MKRPEQELQMAVCQYLDLALPNGWRYWATYNNAKNKTQGGINKAMGVKAGVPDLFIAGPHMGNLRLIGIELKTGKAQASTEQEDWLIWLSSNGAEATICRSIEDVEDVLIGVLGIAGVPLRPSTGEG